MKSVKPGRYPSMRGAIMGAIAAVFGVIWVIGTICLGAPIFFPIFGIVFIGIAVTNAFHDYKNATGENRTSLYDITDEDEEPDPTEVYIRQWPTIPTPSAKDNDDLKYCPYCGRPVDDSFEYCPKCGKKLP